MMEHHQFPFSVCVLLSFSAFHSVCSFSMNEISSCVVNVNVLIFLFICIRYKELHQNSNSVNIYQIHKILFQHYFNMLFLCLI